MSPYSTPDLYEEYPLVLTTGGRSFVSFHSEHRQIPSLRSLHPDPLLTIHPDTAKKLGINDGDYVCIENPLGKCVERARVSKEVDPRVVHAEHGWWFPEDDPEAPNLYGVWKSNINRLIPMYKVGITGYGAPYKNVLCKVYKVDSPDFANEEASAYVPREDRGPQSMTTGESQPNSYEAQQARIAAEKE